MVYLSVTGVPMRTVFTFALAVCLIFPLASHAENTTLTSIKGISVGHVTDGENLKGVTVIRFPRDGAFAGVDVRGSAPGTCETDLLAPVNLVDRINALVLSGGSAYGVHSAAGVMKCLEEDGIGLDTGGILVPIVPAAIIFDLAVGKSSVRPTADWGYKACKGASGNPVEQGNVGAGTGATVGKMFGKDHAMKGGLGSYSIDLPGGVIVSALVAVNTVGDVIDPSTGKILAGTRAKEKGTFEDSTRLLRENASITIFPGRNTTIGVVATNARYSKTELTKIAQMAHDGLARAIRPAHTMYDGDTIFAVSVPDRSVRARPSVTTIGSAAADAFAEAIVQAIKHADGIEGYPSIKDW
jgi:L-aminopeptidase/D-esterase-like protein